MREVRGDDETPYAAPFESFFYGAGQFVLSDPVDRGLVFRRPLGEALDKFFALCVIFLAVANLDGYVFGTLTLRHVAGGTPDAPKDRLFRTRH